MKWYTNPGHWELKNLRTDIFNHIMVHRPRARGHRILNNFSRNMRSNLKSKKRIWGFFVPLDTIINHFEDMMNTFFVQSSSTAATPSAAHHSLPVVPPSSRRWLELAHHLTLGLLLSPLVHVASASNAPHTRPTQMVRHCSLKVLLSRSCLTLSLPPQHTWAEHRTSVPALPIHGIVSPPYAFNFPLLPPPPPFHLYGLFAPRTHVHNLRSCTWSPGTHTSDINPYYIQIQVNTLLSPTFNLWLALSFSV